MGAVALPAISQANRRRASSATCAERDGGPDQMFGLPTRDATFARKAIAIGFAAVELQRVVVVDTRQSPKFATILSKRTRGPHHRSTEFDRDVEDESRIEHRQRGADHAPPCAQLRCRRRRPCLHGERTVHAPHNVARRIGTPGSSATGDFAHPPTLVGTRANPLRRPFRPIHSSRCRRSRRPDP
jgi:hypothetical protein